MYASATAGLYPWADRMGFFLFTMVVVAVIVLVLVLVGKAYPGSGADLLDWQPTRSHELEAQLEVDDIQQMLDAQNEYRRKRGAKEITEADAQRYAAEDEAVRRKHRDMIEEDLGT
jgi:hypothetical protein